MKHLYTKFPNVILSALLRHSLSLVPLLCFLNVFLFPVSAAVTPTTLGTYFLTSVTRPKSATQFLKVNDGCYLYREGSCSYSSSNGGAKTSDNASGYVFYFDDTFSVSSLVTLTGDKKGSDVTVTIYKTDSANFAKFVNGTENSTKITLDKKTEVGSFTVPILSTAPKGTFSGACKSNFEAGYYYVVASAGSSSTYWTSMTLTEPVCTPPTTALKITTSATIIERGETVTISVVSGTGNGEPVTYSVKPSTGSITSAGVFSATASGTYTVIVTQPDEMTAKKCGAVDSVKIFVPYHECHSETIIKSVHTGKTTADCSGTLQGGYQKSTEKDGKLNSNGHFFVYLASGNYFEPGDSVYFEVPAVNNATAIDIYLGGKTAHTKTYSVPMNGAGTYVFVLPDDFPANIDTLGVYREDGSQNATYQSIEVRRYSCPGCDGIEQYAPTLGVSDSTMERETGSITLTPSTFNTNLFRSEYTITPSTATITNNVFHSDVVGTYIIEYSIVHKHHPDCRLSCTQQVEVTLQPCEQTPDVVPTSSVFRLTDGKLVSLTLATLEAKNTSVTYSLTSVPTLVGCTFYMDERELHISGTPNVGVTDANGVDYPLAFTFTNDCTPALTVTATITVKVFPSSHKPAIAYIVSGTKEGAFTAYTTDDKDESQTLLDYLATDFDVTVVNGYATKDAAKLETYYSNYDLLFVTDFMETSQGYTNALGTLIDKKPFLSTEAFVARLSNWHIQSNPSTASPMATKMRLLCAAHSIFNGTTISGDALNREIQVLSSANNGMQGFVLNQIYDFLPLATISDTNNGELIVCSERQAVFLARLIILGIQNSDTKLLTNDGKLIIKQILHYLLETDESKLADCSMVFDNANGTGLWSDAKNWAPAHSFLPTPYHPVRIEQPCTVDIPNAHAATMKINQGLKPDGSSLAGSITITPTGGLLIAGLISKVQDSKYFSLRPTSVQDITVKADATGNGALVFGTQESDVYATVQYFSKGYGANVSAEPVWQYIGTPLQADHTAVSMFYGAWMCRWGVSDNIGGLWEWVANEDILQPFEGYCITQDVSKTYTLQGRLNKPTTHSISFTVRDTEGYAFAANSWTAPIKIGNLSSSDFVNADATIYLFHSGTYNNSQSATDADATSAVASLPGQYAVIPVNASPYMAGADSVIPAMQGFFVKTSALPATMQIEYSSAVYDAKNFACSTTPMRAPRRRTASPTETTPQVLRIDLQGKQYGGDRVWVLSANSFTEQFENGWDGIKAEGGSDVPMLSFVKEAGEMAVAAVPVIDEHTLSFRAGKDSVYTFLFDYEGDPLYIMDRQTQAVTRVQSGQTYTFMATNRTQAEQRFVFTAHPQSVTTSVETVVDNGKLHIENYAGEQVEVSIFASQGCCLYHYLSQDKVINLHPELPTGVYIVQIKMGSEVQTVKLLGGE